MINWLDALLGLNNLENDDGSIDVAGNKVSVGTLASDAQHGARGGATMFFPLHTSATTSSPGFMSAADKQKVNGESSLLVVNNLPGPNAPVPAGYIGVAFHRGDVSGTPRNQALLIWDETNGIFGFAFDTNGDGTPGALVPITASLVAANNITLQSATGAGVVHNDSSGVMSSSAVVAADVSSGVAGGGTVLTADGAGGAAWQAASGGTTQQPLSLASLGAPSAASYNQQWTFGYSFYADSSQSMTGIRIYWKYSGSGTDSIKLSVWDLSGTRVATVTVTATADGFVTGTFGSPLAILPGVPYWLSTYCTSGAHQTYCPNSFSPAAVDVSLIPYGPVGGGFIYSQLNLGANSDTKPTNVGFLPSVSSFTPMDPVFA